MSYLSAMPKDPEKKRIEAHLTPDEFAHFEAIAKEKQWSLKKLNENIVREFLKTQKKKK